jgi:hypothetical protein
MTSFQITVFIVYGGTEGANIGDDLYTRLSRKGFSPFFVHPKVPNMRSGQKTKSYFKNLFESHVVVAIITDDFTGSKGEEDVEFLLENNQSEKIVQFLHHDCRLPSYLKTFWHPCYFAKHHHEEAVPRLVDEIHRMYIELYTTQTTQIDMEKDSYPATVTPYNGKR